MSVEHMLWNEQFRPHKIEDCILPQNLKDTFQSMVDKGEIPNMTLAGPAGTGKTTVARALCDQLGYEYIIINGSDEGRLIDTLRTKIRNFASAVSFGGTRKMVILDEADYLSLESVQPALRNFIESFSGTCGFILTCNFPNKIMDALQSRAPIVDFKFPVDTRGAIELAIFQRIINILREKSVDFDKKVVATVVKKNYPDFRKTLNLLQRYAATGKIDEGILSQVGSLKIEELIKLMRDKKYKEIREWVGSESVDMSSLCKALYESLATKLNDNGHAQVVMHLANYQYRHSFVADPEINITAMLVEIMVDTNGNWV